MRIAHLSDLHFGAEVPEVVAGLRADLADQDVGQVLHSGDLTMRARRAEFQGARALLDSLGRPWTSVPGNHDLPLDRVLTRQVRPLHAYRTWVDDEPEPRRLRDGVLVVGLSTARRYYWKDGRVDSGQVARIGRDFEAGEPVALRVLMMHHPVFVSAQRPAERVVGGAERAIEAAAAAGVDLILCGHDHVAAHVDLASARPALGRHVLSVMAGTATSYRVRAGESQSYNVFDLTGDRLTLTVRRWDGHRFRGRPATTWHRTPQGWVQ